MFDASRRAERWCRMESTRRLIDCRCACAAWWNAAPNSGGLSDGAAVCDSVERLYHENLDRWERGKSAHLLWVAAEEVENEGASPLRRGLWPGNTC